MPILLGLVLLLVVEVAVVAVVSSWIGFGWTLLAAAGHQRCSAAGWCAGRAAGPGGRSAPRWRRAGRPGGRRSTACSILLGGLLVLLPGFVSDVLGLLCLLPPTRRLLGRVLVGWALTRGQATVVRVRSTRAPAGPGGPAGPGARPGPPPAPGAGRVIEGEIEPPRP